MVDGGCRQVTNLQERDDDVTDGGPGVEQREEVDAPVAGEGEPRQVAERGHG